MSSSIPVTQQTLRDEMRTRLSTITKTACDERSTRAQANLLRFLEQRQLLGRGRIVALYSALPRGELHTHLLAPALKALGVRVVFPRVADPVQKLLEFREPTLDALSGSAEWVRSRWGIWEPTPACLLVPPQMLDVILVPGLVFDASGGRLGRGAGYYDRFLQKAPQAFKVGYAFDFQVSPQSLPQNPWDQRVDAVITDEVGNRSIESRSL